MTFNSEDEKNSKVKELLEKSAKHTKQLKLVLEKLDEIDKRFMRWCLQDLLMKMRKQKLKKSLRKKVLVDLQVHTKQSKGNMLRCLTTER